MIKLFWFYSREICPFGEEISQESIGMFIKSTFPRMKRSGAIYDDPQIFRNAFMAADFFAIVVRHRQTQGFRDSGKCLTSCLHEIICTLCLDECRLKIF